MMLKIEKNVKKKEGVGDEKEVGEHLGRKGKGIWVVGEKVVDEVEEKEEVEVFEGVEMGLGHIVGEMEWMGVEVDVERVKKMGEEVCAKLGE